MKIETLVVGQLATNCYLAWCPATLRAVIIDPGDAGDFIIQKILDLKLKPELIVATHGHFDHVLAVTELRLAFGVPFILHQKDEPLLKRAGRIAQYFTGLRSDPVVRPDQFIKEGDVLRFGKQNLRIIETPGHTPGSICLYSESIHLRGGVAPAAHLGGDRILFSGDTLFAGGGMGRTDLPGGNQNQLLGSIKNKLLVLPDDTVVCPGHGEMTTIGEEKQYY